MSYSGHKTTCIGQCIYWITLLHLVTGLLLTTTSLFTGDDHWVKYFFDLQSPLFLLTFSGLGLCLSAIAWWQFGTGESMRWAWLLITVASWCRFVGLTIIHVFGTTPGEGHGSVFPAARLDGVALLQLGHAVSGPIHMLVLAVGLLVVLGTYRRFGMLIQFSTTDYALFGFVSAFTIYRLFEWSLWLVKPDNPVSFYETAKWFTDPLLCVLLFEAVFIRRAVLNMGWGLVAKCWGGFTAAILITLIGNVGSWAATHGYLAMPVVSLFWITWCLAIAAYALGPAYQVEATLRARERLRNFVAA